MTQLTHHPLPPDTAWPAAPRGRTTAAAPAPSWLAPLLARAQGDRLFPRLAIADAHAPSLLQLAGVDADTARMPRSAVAGVLARTHAMRAAAARFFDRHPRGLGVSLGAGLSHPFQWLDKGSNRWLDVDLPEVAQLRQRWLPAEHPRRHTAQADLAGAGWWQRLGLPSGRHEAPVLLLAEDLVHHLDPAAVQRLLWNVGQYAPPGSMLLLDALAWPLARRLGPNGFGLRRSAELAAMHPRLRLDAVHHTFRRHSAWHRVASPLFQVLFGVPGVAVYELGVDA
jgi:O-methyltransferase involved in polyketide biosynthesis